MEYVPPVGARPAPPPPPVGSRPAPPPIPQGETTTITPTERAVDDNISSTSSSTCRISSVKNRAAFFESVGQDIQGPVPANISQVIQQSQGIQLGYDATVNDCNNQEGQSEEQYSSTNHLQSSLSDETRLVKSNFVAMESWQLPVTAGDIVQLSGEKNVDDGWSSVILITKNHPNYGSRGCVPTSYLVQVRQNILTDTLPSNYIPPSAPPKKYKPKAKNLKSRPGSAGSGSKRSWF